MKYYIQRGLNEYGPYTLADLQRYIASGNIQLSDLTRSEAMTEWMPVSQVIGNIPLPAPAAPPSATPYGSTAAAGAGTVYGGATPGASSSPAASIPTYDSPAGSSAAPSYTGAATPAGGTVYGGPSSPQAVQTYPGAVPAAPVGYPVRPSSGPMPPVLHWALVWLIGSVTCLIFLLVWLFIEASFVKKLKADNNSITFLVGGIVTQFLAAAMLVAVAVQVANNPGSQGPGFVIFFGFLMMAGAVLHIVGIFKMRDGMVEYYNTVDPINLRLSAVMTFFFNILYFQYHFTRIANWKKTGYLAPQQ